jgi:hypothetical protein
LEFLRLRANLRTVALSHVWDNWLHLCLRAKSPAFEQQPIVRNALLVREKTRRNAVEGITDAAQILVNGEIVDLSHFLAHFVGLRFDPNPGESPPHPRINVRVPEKKLMSVVQLLDLAYRCEPGSP